MRIIFFLKGNRHCEVKSAKINKDSISLTSMNEKTYDYKFSDIENVAWDTGKPGTWIKGRYVTGEGAIVEKLESVAI